MTDLKIPLSLSRVDTKFFKKFFKLKKGGEEGGVAAASVKSNGMMKSVENLSKQVELMAMIGANLRFGIGASGNASSNATKVFQCHPGGATEASLIFGLGALGMGANFLLMALILAKRQLRR